MKICHISTVHGTFDVRIFHKQCKSLKAAGYDVTLIVQGENQTAEGVKIVGLRKPKNRFDRFLRLSSEAYTLAVKENADLYQIHDPELLPMANKLKKMGKKVIFDSHEIYSVQIAEKGYLPKWARGIVRKLYTAMESKYVKNLDAVLVPCTVKGKNVFEGRTKKTIYIANYPKLSEIHGPTASSNKACTDTICFLGKLSKGHGFTELMKAAYLADFRVIAAGDASLEYMEYLKAQKEFSCVDYRGYVSRQEVAEILSASTAGAATYYLEGQYALPLDNVVTKAYEYMAAELPVIYTRRSFTEYFFEKKYFCGACVDAKNVQEIAEVLKKFHNDAEYSKQMGANGRKTIVSNMNWEKEAKKLVSAYQEILAE